jgi:GNAT superfamily N-acetyltransferase
MRAVLAGFEWLGGLLWIERGSVRDYTALSRFHYAHKGPATWAGVWVVRWEENDERGTMNDERDAKKSESSIHRSSFIVHRSRVIAAGVLSYPTLRCFARESVLPRAREAGWVNENLRTISRVVVHPQFRGVGVASRLVRVMCEEAGTGYVEAIAAMGKVHPFFEKGGMKRIESEGEKGYFLWKI